MAVANIFQILSQGNKILQGFRPPPKPVKKKEVKPPKKVDYLEEMKKRNAKKSAELGKTLQKFPDTTIRKPQIQNPILKLIKSPSLDLTEFISAMPGEVIRQYGRTIERLNTEKGKKENTLGRSQFPGQVKKLLTGGFKNVPQNASEILNNPAVQTVSDLSDFVPGIGYFGVGGIKKVGKEGVEKFIKKGAEKVVMHADEIEDGSKALRRLFDFFDTNDIKYAMGKQIKNDEFVVRDLAKSYIDKALAKKGKIEDVASELWKKIKTDRTAIPQKPASLFDKIKSTLKDERGYINLKAKVGKEKPVVPVKSSQGIIPQVSEALERVSKQVNPPRVKDPILKNFSNKVKSFTSVIKEKLVDSFSPIEDTINEITKKAKITLKATDDPRLIRNRVLGAEGIGSQMLKKDIEPILKSVGAKDIDEFEQYLVSRHALDVSGRGIETGIDPADAKTIVDNLGGKYEEAAKGITNYTQKVLKYVQEAGLISQDTYNTLLTRYPNYVPLNRIMDDLNDVVSIPNKSIGSLGKQTVVRKLVGSEREIESPLASIVNKTMEAVDQAERNRVAQSIVNLKNYEGFRNIIKEIPQAKNKNTISVFENGTKKFFEVPEEFERAAKNLDKAHMDILTKIASYPVRVARLGITGINLPFIATNIVRDQLFTMITSKHVGKTSIAHPFNFIKAFLDSAGSKGVYDDFIAAGGGSSNFFSVARDNAKKTVSELVSGRKSKLAKTIINPTKWVSSLEDIVGVSEQTTRTQQFMGYRQALGGKGRIDPFAKPTDESLQALQAGRENSVDFAKKGAWGQVLNSAFIYLNTGIQGARTTLRSFKNNPIATSAKLAATVYTPIALTTLWNTATEERKKAYMDIPDYEKQNNLIILPPNPVKDDKGRYSGSIKIPLPQGFLALAIPVRSGIEQLQGAGQDKVQEVLFNMLGKLGPVDFSSGSELASRVTPTAVLPVIEDLTNTKLFSGAPIVPRAQQDLEPGLQYGKDTTATAKGIGTKLNISPAKLENYIRGYTGDVGLQVLNAVDNIMNKLGIISDEEVGGVSIGENILRRFTQTAGGKQDEIDFQKIEKIARESKTVSFKEKQEAQKILDDITDHPDRLNQYIKEGKLTDSIKEKMKKLMEDEINDLSSQEKYLKSQSNDSKAQFILDKINTMDPSKIGSYVNDLKSRKVISADVEEKIMELMKSELGEEPSNVQAEKQPQSMIRAETAPITQEFGNYNPEIEIFSNGVNTGTDFGINEDTELAVPEGDWEVVEAYDGDGMNSGYGKSVLVENKRTGERIRLSHLNQALVNPGDSIRGGGIIGISGSTGNSTGPHVDVEYFDTDGQIADILKSKYAMNI